MKRYLAFALVLLLLCGCAASPKENTVSVDFPFGQLPNPHKIPHYDAINSTAPFKAAVTLPKGWKISEKPGEAVMPLGEFYSMRYIFDGDTPIGYIGFDIFEDDNDSKEKDRKWKEYKECIAAYSEKMSNSKKQLLKRAMFLNLMLIL